VAIFVYFFFRAQKTTLPLRKIGGKFSRAKKMLSCDRKVVFQKKKQLTGAYVVSKYAGSSRTNAMVNLECLIFSPYTIYPTNTATNPNLS
jgi:hypothetical protein